MSLFENSETTTAKLEDFVGEGKKYRDPDAVAKALVEKDNFIERLKAEKEELYKEVVTKSTTDRSQEILDRIEALKAAAQVTERPPITPEPERTEVKGLSLDDVERVLNEREKRARADANINSVKAKLQEQFGDKYGQALKSMAEKNGLSEKALNDLAAQSPQLILNLMGSVSKQETLFTPPSSSTNPDAFVPSAGGAKTLSWYNQMKAQDKAKYFSASVQSQMYKDAMALKEAFNDV